MLQVSSKDNQPDLSSTPNLTVGQLKVAYTPRSEIEADESEEEEEYAPASSDDVDFSRNAFDALNDQ